MLPPRRAAPAAPARTLLVLLATLLTCTGGAENPREKFEVVVTAALGGSGGELAAGVLRALVAASLGAPGRPQPPPPACAELADSPACLRAVAKLFYDERLHVALLPVPPEPRAAGPSWRELKLYSGGEDFGNAMPQPLRRQCRAPPPARSLLDLAQPQLAARYPPPPGLRARTRCAGAVCAAVLVTAEAEINETAAAIEENGLLAQVYVLDGNLTLNFSDSEGPIVCDFAPELGIPLPPTWRILGPPPCNSTSCAFESRRLVKIVNVRLLFNQETAIRELQNFSVNIQDLKNMSAEAQIEGPENVARRWAKRLSTAWRQQVRVATLLPGPDSWLDAADSAALAAAAQLAEQEAPTTSASFKVELQAACSPPELSAFLGRAVYSEYKSLAAVAGPACDAAWRSLVHQSSLPALPLLAFTAQAAGGAARGAALLAAGALRDEAAALGAWLAAQGWRRLALLASADHASHVEPALAAQLVVRVTLPEPGTDPDYELIEQWAERAAAEEARILYVWSEDVRVVAAALCAAGARGLTPAAGAVLLLPPAPAAALRAAARCDVARLLPARVTAAPAWRAAWDGWAGAARRDSAAWRARWRAQCRRDLRRRPRCAAPPPAAAALLYDLLSLWFQTLHRMIADNPFIARNLHDYAVVEKVAENATGQKYSGVTGDFEWKMHRDNSTWSRISTIVIAQWDDGNDTWRGVATWNGSRLQQVAAPRWLTRDGRRPDDGGACALRLVRDALHVSCGAAWALVAVAPVAALLAALAAAALQWRRRAERSFRRRLAALGLRALPPAGVDRWEVPRERVVINRKLGTGAFGTVYGGHALLGEHGWSAVAVKTLKPGASTEEKLDFLAEAEAMKRLDHKNVVRLLGVVTKTEPVCTVMEFMLYGDLKTYLLARRHVADESEVGARRLTAMALDAARALSYLAEQRWVHRDVAARNCLVSARRVLKLADFGMARRVYDGDYYRLRRRGMLPVRWMAPEALATGEFSAASDVWAFGVLLYEMVTLGALPFAGLSNAEVLARVQAGRALEPPAGVKPQLEALMRACWAPRARARPGAAEVAAFLAEQPRLLAPTAAPPLDALPLAHAHRAAALWRLHDGPDTDTTDLSDARDTDRCLPDEPRTPP